MCGIVAMYSAREPIPADALERATLRLAHRGPDGQRTWVSDDRRVGLGHARLSIIDLATGDQPIASEDETPAHRRQRRVLRLRARSQRDLEQPGPPPPHPLRQRDRPAPLRGPRHRLPARTCAASSPSCSGTARTTRSSPRGIASASSLSTTRQHGGTLYLASEIKALLAAGVPAALGPRRVLPGQPLRWRPPRTAPSSTASIRCRPATSCSPTAGSVRLIRYWDFDYPAADDARPAGPDAEYAERFRARPGRGGPPAPAGRRAGRLLPQRRDRLLRRAGPGGDAPERSDPGLHADLRPGRLRRGGHRPRDGGARRRRVPPDPDPAVRPGRPLRRRDLPGRDALLQRPRRGEVPAEPGRARRRVQGRADRRRRRRDPRRLSATSGGTCCCTTRRGRTRTTVRQLLEQLQASNPVSRGLLLPDGEAPPLASVRRAARVRALVAGGPRDDRVPAPRPVRARLRRRVRRRATPTASS